MTHLPGSDLLSPRIGWPTGKTMSGGRGGVFWLFMGWLLYQGQIEGLGRTQAKAAA